MYRSTRAIMAGRAPLAADAPIDTGEETVPPAPRVTRRGIAVAGTVGAFLVALPILSLLEVIRIHYAWASLPLALLGAGSLATVIHGCLAELKGATTSGEAEPSEEAMPELELLEPAPGELVSPQFSEASELRFLNDHPELLAAAVLGVSRAGTVRMIGEVASTDPWKIYRVLSEGSAAMEEAFLKDMRRLAEEACLAEQGSTSRPMRIRMTRIALEWFQCAARKSGAEDLTLPEVFYPLVIALGLGAPGNHRPLASLAPRVRALIETEYPGMASVVLKDGTRISYHDWQRQALANEKQIRRLESKNARLEKRVQCLEARAGDLGAELEAWPARASAREKEAESRARQAVGQDLAALREQVKELRGRAEAAEGSAKADQLALLATIEALSKERESLSAMLAQREQPGNGATEELPPPAPGRILLVGGEAKYVEPLRNQLAEHGVQVLHASDNTAAAMISSADQVVFWTRFLTHSTFYAVRNICKARGVKYACWPTTSPASLIRLLSGDGSEDLSNAACP
jgi:hypothetical protein